MANSNEYMRKYMRDRYYRRRASAIAQLGGQCTVCGTTENLHFDHIEPAAKAFAIGKAFAGFSDARLQEELNKCQLLCQLHHIEKTKIDAQNRHAVVAQMDRAAHF